MGFLLFRDLPGKQFAQVDPSRLVMPSEEVAVWMDAQALLSRAREDADRIRQEALDALEAHKRKGYEEGLAAAQMEQAERMIDNASRMVDFFASVEQRMVGLVMESMRRIIDDFDDTQRVMAVVRSGLAVLRNQKQLTLRLAPQHVEAVKERAAELLSAFPGIGMLDIVGDSRLKGDAAILESDIGVVEASTEMQLQALEQGFRKMLGSRV